MDHVYSFMLAEMGTTGSIDASSRMVIKGRFPPKAIEQIIRRYVGEYVSCASCKSPATALQKQNRLYFMQVWARGIHAAYTACGIHCMRVCRCGIAAYTHAQRVWYSHGQPLV